MNSERVALAHLLDEDTIRRWRRACGEGGRKALVRFAAGGSALADAETSGRDGGGSIVAFARMRRFPGVAAKNLRKGRGWRAALEALAAQSHARRRILGAAGLGLVNEIRYQRVSN